MTNKPALPLTVAALLAAALSFTACTPPQNPELDNGSSASETPSRPVPPEPGEQTPVTPPPATERQGLTVYVFDVGEALSVFIDDEETEVLIDAGNDRDGSVIANKVPLRRYHDRLRAERHQAFATR